MDINKEENSLKDEMKSNKSSSGICNIKLLSTNKHSLDYLPKSLVKLIIDKNLLTFIKDPIPTEYKFQTCFLYIDFSKLKPSFLKIRQQSKIGFSDYIHYNINRFIEKIISIINSCGGDCIIYETSLHVFIPPDFNSFNNDKITQEKLLIIILRAVQCALEIQKLFKDSEIEKHCCFKIIMGMGAGECKLLILGNLENKNDLNENCVNNENKLYYLFLGKALNDSYNCALRSNENDIIIDENIYMYLNELYELIEIENDTQNNKKYYNVIRLINQDVIAKIQNKSIINLFKFTIANEKMLNAKKIVYKFNPYFILKELGGNSINEKWIKESRNTTILILRPKMNMKDKENPKKLQELISVLIDLTYELGGVIYRILSDIKGILIIILFGLKNFSISIQNEFMSVLFAFEITTRLKKINIYPYIGISTDLTHICFTGSMGGRREFVVMDDAYLIAKECLFCAENLYGDKMFGGNNIIIDKNTLNVIDSIIPCKIYKKINVYPDENIIIYIPVKIENFNGIHKENNLFPLLSCHLYFKDRYCEIDDESLMKDKNFFKFPDKNLMIEFVDLFDKYVQKQLNIKLFEIMGLSGSGKTVFITESLKMFYRKNHLLREILCNKILKNDFPYFFISNLDVVMHSKNFNYYERKELKGIQYIMKEIFDLLFAEEEGKTIIIELIRKNQCVRHCSFLMEYFENNELDIIFHDEINNMSSDEESDESSEHGNTKNTTYITDAKNSSQVLFEKTNFFNLLIDILIKYKDYINLRHEEKLKEYNIQIPIVILLDNINSVDELTLDFIKYYLKENIPSHIIFITINTIPSYPPYALLEKNLIDFFYEFPDSRRIIDKTADENDFCIYKFGISPLYTEELANDFVSSILYEMRGTYIEVISKSLSKFLVNKLRGNQENILKMILYLFDKQYIIADKNAKKLTTSPKFEKMIERNDFIDLEIPYSIEKNISNIINQVLTVDETALLKICAVLGDKFDTIRLKHVIKNSNYYLTPNSYSKIIENDFDLYQKILVLENKNIVSILEDSQIKHKYVICKFSIPFMREILYQRTTIEMRTRLHYIIGKVINSSIDRCTNYFNFKYYTDEIELENLINHLKDSDNIGIYNDDVDNLNINNLKTIIIQDICSKIASSSSDRGVNNLIRSGYILKQSNNGVTNSKRFFVLTTNKLLYYYFEEDFKKNKEPLGFFYLRDLFDLQVIKRNKKNTFCLTVNEWRKKKELRKTRIYFLTTESREELYKWTISLNIIKIKCFYDNYCENYGFVRFPLFKKEQIKRKIKFHKFALNLHNNAGCCHYSSISSNNSANIFNKNDLRNLNKRISNRKLSIISNCFCLNIKESYSTKRKKQHLLVQNMHCSFFFVFRYALPFFWSDIQTKIQNFESIKSIKNKKKNFFYNYDFSATYYIHNKKTKEKMHAENAGVNENIEKIRHINEYEKKNFIIYNKSDFEDLPSTYIEYLKKFYEYELKEYKAMPRIENIEQNDIKNLGEIITAKNSNGNNGFEFIAQKENKEETEDNDDNLRICDYLAESFSKNNYQICKRRSIKEGNTRSSTVYSKNSRFSTQHQDLIINKKVVPVFSLTKKYSEKQNTNLIKLQKCSEGKSKSSNDSQSYSNISDSNDSSEGTKSYKSNISNNVKNSKNNDNEKLEKKNINSNNNNNNDVKKDADLHSIYQPTIKNKNEKNSSQKNKDDDSMKKEVIYRNSKIYNINDKNKTLLNNINMARRSSAINFKEISEKQKKKKVGEETVELVNNTLLNENVLPLNNINNNINNTNIKKKRGHFNSVENISNKNIKVDIFNGEVEDKGKNFDFGKFLNNYMETYDMENYYNRRMKSKSFRSAFKKPNIKVVVNNNENEVSVSGTSLSSDSSSSSEDKSKKEEKNTEKKEEKNKEKKEKKNKENLDDENLNIENVKKNIDNLNNKKIDNKVKNKNEKDDFKRVITFESGKNKSKNTLTKISKKDNTEIISKESFQKISNSSSTNKDKDSKNNNLNQVSNFFLGFLSKPSYAKKDSLINRKSQQRNSQKSDLSMTSSISAQSGKFQETNDKFRKNSQVSKISDNSKKSSQKNLEKSSKKSSKKSSEKSSKKSKNSEKIDKKSDNTISVKNLTSQKEKELSVNFSSDSDYSIENNSFIMTIESEAKIQKINYFEDETEIINNIKNNINNININVNDFHKTLPIKKLNLKQIQIQKNNSLVNNKNNFLSTRKIKQPYKIERTFTISNVSFQIEKNEKELAQTDRNPQSNLDKTMQMWSLFNPSGKNSNQDSNNSYSYIKNFIDDNSHETRKHCLLRQKAYNCLQSKLNKNKEENENCENNHLNMINKLKNNDLSMNQEKEYLGIFKDLINSERNSKGNDGACNTSRISTKCRSNRDIPDVYYINENDNLHNKVHKSYLFTKLKANNK